MWSVALANIVGAGLCFGFAPVIAKITSLRFVLLTPILLIIICFAAYQATKDPGDLVVVAAFGILGSLMKRYGWSRPALLIGFVLASKLEASIYQTVVVYGWSAFAKPIVIILAAVIALILWRTISRKTKQTASLLSETRSLGQVVILGGFAAFAVWTFQGALNFDKLTGFFPLVASGAVLILLAILVFAHFYIPGSRIWEDYDSPTSGVNTDLMSFWASIFVFVAFVVSVALIGLLASSVIAVMAFYSFVSRENLKVSIPISIGLLLFLLLLQSVLNVAFPTGVIGLI